MIALKTNLLNFKLCILLLCSLFCASCYDGWESPTTNGVGNTNQSSSASIYAIELVTIKMGDDMANSSSCYSNYYAASYRIAEWNQRIASLAAALQPLSAQFITSPVTVSASDCVNLTAVQTAALSISQLESLAPDALNRPIVQIKAVFWDADITGSFSSVVTDENWSSIKLLAYKGKKVVSLNYFSLSNFVMSYNYFFYGWWSTRYSGSNSSRVKSATTIDSIDPTSSGIAQRTQLAAQDATKAAAWVVSEAAKIK